ncbi:MAG TPA: hypothetical protein VHD33_02965 [Legionellaceae bacterium]|nr:hypothetical protein [Legionellaceae bacterium]
MRKLLWLFFVIVMNVTYGYGVHEDHPYEFLMKKYGYKFSERYEISSSPMGVGKTYSGSIKKSAFRIRNNYDLSNLHGWQATGITRILSLGTLYSWATDIDIYDTRGVKIAFIDGSFATLESARFDLYEYDEAGKSKQIGIAYADANFTRFNIMTPNKQYSIADLQRNINENYWTVTVNYPAEIDDRLLRIFAGFIVDYQDKFKVIRDEAQKTG